MYRNGARWIGVQMAGASAIEVDPVHSVGCCTSFVLVADGLVGDTERHLLAGLRVPVGDVRCACDAFCPGVPPMRTVFIAVVCQFLCDFVAGKRFDAFGVVLAAGDDEFVSILAGFDQVVDGLRVNLRSTAAPAPAALTRACGAHLNAD